MPPTGGNLACTAMAPPMGVAIYQVNRSSERHVMKPEVHDTAMSDLAYFSGLQRSGIARARERGLICTYMRNIVSQ